MEINQLKMTGGLYQKSVGGRSVKSVGSDSGVKTSAARVENSDKLELSSAASQQYEIYRVTKSVMSQIDEDGQSGRVEELKAQVQNGTYRVPIEALADKLLDRLTM